MAALSYKIGDADEYPSDNTTSAYSALTGYTFQRNPTEDDRDMGRKLELIEDMLWNQNSAQNFSNVINTPVIHGAFYNDATHDKDEEFQKLCRQLLTGKEQKYYCLKEPYTFGGTAYYRFMYLIAAERAKAIKRGGQDANKLEYEFSLKQVDPFLYDENVQEKGKWDVTGSSPKTFTLTGGTDALKIFNLGSAWAEPCWAIKNNGAADITAISISEASGINADNINSFQIDWTGTLPNSSNNVLYIKPRTISDWSSYRYNVWKYGTYSTSPSETASTLYNTSGWNIAALPGKMPRAKAGYTSASPQSLYIKITSGASVDADVWAIYRYRWF